MNTATKPVEELERLFQAMGQLHWHLQEDPRCRHVREDFGKLFQSMNTLRPLFQARYADTEPERCAALRQLSHVAAPTVLKTPGRPDEELAFTYELSSTAKGAMMPANIHEHSTNTPLMKEMWLQIQEILTSYTPNLVAALFVLVVGWLFAWLFAWIVRKLLARTALDNRLGRWIADTEGKPMPVEQWVSRGVFYLMMLFVLLAFLHTLQLTVLTDPIKNILASFADYVPRLVAAAMLTFVAWVLATVVRKLVLGALAAARLDERLNQAAGPGEKPVAGVGKPLAEAAYWIVFLIFLPAVLEALNLKALIEPVNVMMNKFFGLIPNLVAAGVTLVVGWFVARIVQRLSASLIASSGLDGFCERWGFSAELGQRKLSEVLGLIIYVLILIPVIIAALDELRLDAVTRPASEMLGTILNKIPQLFGVALIFILAYVVGQVVGTLAMNVLRGLGFDQVLVKIGLARQPAKGPTAPAAIAGLLIQIGVMLLAAMAAAETLGFLQVATVINDFLHFASKVILGLILFGLGLMLAQVVANAISASDSPRSRILAWVARIGISVLIGAMALRATGVAESIVNLAFGALVCGLAAAGALAFGLGGRKTAAGQLEKWQADYERFVNQQSPPNP